MRSFTIGQLAREAGVGVETIRFYHRRGLIDEPPRRNSGYRDYPRESVVRLRFIRRAKELGFSLKEIRDLLSLRIDSDHACEEVKQRVLAKIAEIEERIQSLREMRKALGQLGEVCEEGGTSADCPLLDALEVSCF